MEQMGVPIPEKIIDKEIKDALYEHEAGGIIESRRSGDRTEFRVMGKDHVITVDSIDDVAQPAYHERFDPKTNTFDRNGESGWLVGGSFLEDENQPFELYSDYDEDEEGNSYGGIIGGGLYFSGDKEHRQLEYVYHGISPIMQKAIESSIEKAIEKTQVEANKQNEKIIEKEKKAEKEKKEGYNVIEKFEHNKRGYGSMTAALFKKKDGTWDYVEVIQPTNSEYQRDVHSISDEMAQQLIGKTLDEIKEMEGIHVQRSKWHCPTISPEGKIISLRC